MFRSTWCATHLLFGYRSNSFRRQVVRAAECAAQAAMLHGLRLARDDVGDDEGVPDGLL